MSTNNLKPEFVQNAAAKGKSEAFIEVNVDVAQILRSWKDSVFSFEWLDEQGHIKDFDELSRREQPKREAVEEKLKCGQPLEMPILGIGLQEHVEIGSGRDVFLTLAAHGHKTLPVHIPKSNEKDFADFIARGSA